MLQLHLNFPRILVFGCPSSFEYRLTNSGALPASDVSITVTCSSLGLTGHESIIGTLAPGASREGHIEVQPEAVGAPTLRFEVEAAYGKQIVRLEGYRKRLTVYDPPKSPANVSVIIQDIQSHRSEGDKAEFGGVKGDVNISVHDLLPKIQSLNDLIQLELPDDFRPVLLQPSLRKDDTEILRIPAPFLKFYQPADVIHLAPDGEVANAEGPLNAWRLCAGSSGVILGRSSQDCDLVTRFLPCNSENNAKSATLSRKHALLRITPQGRVQAESLTSHALVHVGTATAPTGVPLPLQEGEVISMGPSMSEFRLSCSLRYVSLARKFRITNFGDSAASRVKLAKSSVADWGRAEFTFLNSTPSFWNLVWFHAPVPFGSVSNGRIGVNSPNLDAALGYFHHHQGAFWIESCAQRDGAVMLNGTQLDDGDIAPLQDGSVLELNGIKFQISRVR